MINKEWWGSQILVDSDLVGMVKIIDPKRKDGLYGVNIGVTENNVADNKIVQSVADTLTTLVRPEEYIFQVAIHDRELGTHISSNSASNPIDAFEMAKRAIKKSLVDAESQQKAIETEEAESRLLDMAENGAIAERVYNAFRFDIESVEISCQPVSWSFTEIEA